MKNKIYVDVIGDQVLILEQTKIIVQGISLKRYRLYTEYPELCPGRTILFQDTLKRNELLLHTLKHIGSL